MKLCILTDLEGVCGVYSFQQTRDFEYGSVMHTEARRLLMGEVNAAIAGACDEGADRVVVRDGHGGGNTFIMEDLDERAEAVMGVVDLKTNFLKRGFDAAFLVGCHAMSNTTNALLCHTQSSRTWENYWINGRLAGEIEQMAILLGACDIPVVMVTGDDKAIAEGRWLLGNRIVTVAVKKSLGHQGAWMVSPRRARKMIYDGARKAIRRVGKLEPYKVEFPLTVRWQFKDKSIVDNYTGPATKIDDTILEKEVTRAEDIFAP